MIFSILLAICAAVQLYEAGTAGLGTNLGQVHLFFGLYILADVFLESRK